MGSAQRCSGGCLLAKTFGVSVAKACRGTVGLMNVIHHKPFMIHEFAGLLWWSALGGCRLHYAMNCAIEPHFNVLRRGASQ
jgi:hypothetical protein